MFKFISSLLLKFFLFEAIYLLIVVAKNRLFLKRKIINYPYEKVHTSRRFRGELCLTRYANGKEKCIGCKICVHFCPSDAISVEIVKDEDKIMRARVFNVDMTKCTYCGNCENACPVDAIVHNNNVNISTYSAKELLYDKERLLLNGDIWDNVLRSKVNKDYPYR